jgi:hypothetical protein
MKVVFQRNYQKTRGLHQKYIFPSGEGWTTTNLLSAIATQNPSSNYDLVTLLIGVQQPISKTFSLYEIP